MNKVYVTTNTKMANGGFRDISDCERFGKPIVMFENPRQIQVNSSRFLFLCEQKLKDFTSEDFLLLSFFVRCIYDGFSDFFRNLRDDSIAQSFKSVYSAG